MILSPKDLLTLPGLKVHSARSAYRRVKQDKGLTARHHRISLRELAEYMGVDLTTDVHIDYASAGPGFVANAKQLFTGAQGTGL